MKRQVSISIFLSLIVIILAWMYIRFNNETRVEDNLITTENEINKEQSITISKEHKAKPYYIQVQDGRLIVIDTKYDSIFMETSIDFETLPKEIQNKIRCGIFFQSEGELYDFLESYSS